MPFRGRGRPGERILVCISEDPRAAGLVRYAKRLADRLHAPFTALCVETRRSLQWTEEERDRVADTLRLAEALGGEAITMPSGGRSIADDVIRFAQANNVTQIVIGKSARSRWFEILHGSVVHDLVRRSGNISVHVIAGDDLARDPIPKKTLRAAEGAAPFDPWPYLVALAAVAAALGVGELIQPVLGVENVDLVFLTAVVGGSRALWALAVAARHRRLVALLQFLLPAADLYVHHRRSHQPRRARVLHRGGGRGLAFRRARTHPDRGRARARARGGIAVCVQPQAGRGRYPR